MRCEVPRSLYARDIVYIYSIGAEEGILRFSMIVVIVSNALVTNNFTDSIKKSKHWLSLLEICHSINVGNVTDTMEGYLQLLPARLNFQ